jgi:hypothetical protein
VVLIQERQITVRITQINFQETGTQRCDCWYVQVTYRGQMWGREGGWVGESTEEILSEI